MTDENPSSLPMEALKTELVLISSISKDPANVNLHPERSIEAIKGSLRRFGQVEPLIVHDGIVIGGNGRLEAMIQLGWTHCSIHRFQGTRSEATALAIALNRSAQFSHFDESALASQLQALATENFDLKIDLGFDESEVNLLLKNALSSQADTSEDNAVPRVSEKEILREKWGVETGQLWLLGSHRLLCGDSRSIADVNRVLQGDRPNIVFTDPPYGVSIGKKNEMLNQFQLSGRNLDSIADDDLSPDQLKESLLPAFRNVRSVMADDCTVFVCSPQGGDLGMMMLMLMRDSGLLVRHIIIWKKNTATFSMGRLDYDYQHEPILLTWGKRHKRPMQGTMRTSVWEVAKPREAKLHPTMKPVELYVNAYLNNSDKGDISFEPYGGSGTALIASHQTGRICRAIEIDPGFAAVCIQRWVDATGGTPELVNSSADPT